MGGWLVISCNKAILDAEAQRELWISEKVGGVFLTSGQEKKREVVLWILKKWDWLETIDRRDLRPFAYLASLTGKPKRDSRVPPRDLVPGIKGIVSQRMEAERPMPDDLRVTHEGDMLVIRLAMKTPTPSASGKTLVVASTRGNQKTGVQIEGKDLYLGVNAYVHAEPKGTK